MNGYVDKWGRVHNKPVTPSDPVPSNNSWIFSACAEKLGAELDYLMLGLCFKECKKKHKYTNKIYFIRSPGKESPPMSRDEILGVSYLGFLRPEHVKNWSFSPYPIPKFSLIETVLQLWDLRNKHRNHFWQYNYDQVYRFAFSVPLSDRHFILSNWGRFNLFYWAIAKIDSFLEKNPVISYLKYGKMIKQMVMTFPEDHPFRTIELKE